LSKKRYVFWYESVDADLEAALRRYCSWPVRRWNCRYI